MLTRVQKWGNSLGLRIPHSFAAEAKFAEGTTVDIAVEEGQLVVRPVRGRRYRLSDLVKKIDRKNIHGEILTGDRTGREVW